MGSNVCCCLRDDGDIKEVDTQEKMEKVNLHSTRSSQVPKMEFENTITKSRANQRISLKSGYFTPDKKDIHSCSIQIQSLIRGFLVRSRLRKKRNNRSFKSISNSFVSNKLNYSTENHRINTKEDKVIQVRDPDANPKNYLDNRRRMFNNIKVKVNDKTYTGEWLNGKRDGFGIVIWDDGAKFKGYFVNDMANGIGKQIHKGGEIYFGQWVNDRACGLGYFTNTKNSRYEGEWENDKHNGFGRQIQLKGSVYSGEFLNGLKHGIGKLELDDGSIYEGEFRNNEINGVGRFTYFDGKSYLGQWKSNKMHGFGTLTYKDDKSFEGYFIDDKKTGFGVFKSGGKIYLGTFESDKFEGEVLIIEKGKYRNSVWKNGKKVSYVETKFKYMSLANEFL
jgi:hypothetical protein